VGAGLAGFFYKALLPGWQVAKMADRGIWLEEKVSKGMLLQRREAPPDVILIGASTTQNHTATEVLAEFGIDAFNYGLPGWDLEDFPYVVQQAIAARPEMIILHLPLNKLEDLPCPFAPRWADTLAHIKVRGMLSDCDLIHDTLLYQIPSVRYKDHLPKYDVEATQGYIDYLLSLENTRAVVEEYQAQINYIRGIPGRYVMTLKSGDAIALSAYRTQRSGNVRTRRVSGADPLVYAMLEYLVQIIRDAGIQPVIVFLPGNMNMRYEVIDMAQLGPLNVPIIQGANYGDDVDFWADIAHFDNEGRIAWSRWLAPQVRLLLDARK